MYIAIDFDGTIVEHDFPEIGNPCPGSFEWMKRFKEAGATLILWTMRSDDQDRQSYLTEAVDFCKENGIEFDFVNEHPQDWTTSPKAYAHAYIDDAAIGCPLRDSFSTERPMVDWSIAGPMIMSMMGR